MRSVHWIGILFMAAAAACASDDGPSCTAAFTHFYASGCYYADPNTRVMRTQSQMIDACNDVRDQAPPRCGDEVDAWVGCHGDTPKTAVALTDCDCSVELKALLDCDGSAGAAGVLRLRPL